MKIKKIIVYILLGITIITSFNQFIGEFYIVKSNSMYPTLKSIEIIFVEKLSYRLGIIKPQLNDVVIFNSNIVDGMHFVKRISEIKRKGEYLLLNDSTVYKIKLVANDEGHDVIEYNGGILIDESVPDIYIPKNNLYYVLGDNKDSSIDSRQFGYILENNIIGRPLLVIFSWDNEALSFIDKIRWKRMFTIIK